MSKLLKLPVGIQSFATMIEEDYVYVDKTKHIYELITEGKFFFLSRPRRFGKSLLVSTLHEIFSGNKQLFDKCYIANTPYQWPKHPVITLSFSLMSSKNADELEKDIEWVLLNIAKQYGINITDAPTIKTKLAALVERLSKTNKVVILIDEYDFPLLNNIGNLETADACRELLHNFFSALKDLTAFIHFIFVTGISKLNLSSAFSGLDNLRDLSLSSIGNNLAIRTKQELLCHLNSFIHMSNYRSSSVSLVLTKKHAEITCYRS